MDKQEHYIYVTSKDSLDIYPTNNVSNFTVVLPKRLHLFGDWQCSLTAITLPKIDAKNKPDLIHVTCSVVGAVSIYASGSRQVLRTIYLNRNKRNYQNAWTFTIPFYLPVNQSRDIAEISFEIRNENLEIIPFVSDTLCCTLHLRHQSVQ